MSKNEILHGVRCLFTFKRYDNGMPRMLQIGYGLLSWFGVLVILFSLTKKLFS